MDNGQRLGSRGWPNNLPAANPDISKNEELFSVVTSVSGNTITLRDSLLSTVEDTLVSHDDTEAVQNTILAADAINGGTVQFAQGTYNLERPNFPLIVNNSVAYPPYVTSLASDPWWAGPAFLVIPNGSHGNINLQGIGKETHLVTSPSFGAYSGLFDAGAFQRPNDATTGIMKISPADKGTNTIMLEKAGDAALLNPGDDIWLYSGSFIQSPCTDTATTTGECHFSELNSVVSIDGTAVTLSHPTSKRYFDDGSSSFGLVKMPVTPHNIGIQHMEIDTSMPITGTGQIYGLLINDVSLPGPITHGAFAGGFKRDVVIENSTWSIGDGDVSYGGEEEYDAFTNLFLLGNVITGVVAQGSEGLSVQARLYASEGTSEITVENNTFINSSLYADQTTDVYISHNVFQNGIVNVGLEYGASTHFFDQGVTADTSYLSFASQNLVSVDNNTFTTDDSYTPPGIIRVGAFTSSFITNNVITYASSNSMGVIDTFSGQIANNVINITQSTASDGIILIPDQSPLGGSSSFDVENNTVNAQSVWSSTLIVDPGFVDSVPICVKNNNWNIVNGTPVLWVPGSVTLSCPQ